ncbi:MAG: AMP-binding protein [Streptosporangiales bacterium]|nr:AMP-binding protein [Streptosporangiales bacterium]
MTTVAEGLLPDYETLASVVERRAAERPDQAWVVDADSGREFTFAELLDACRRIAALLEQHGVGPGDRVAVLSENSLEEAVLHVAVMRYGVVLCPVNTTVGEKNLEHVLATVAPRLVFVNAGHTVHEQLAALPDGVSRVEYGAHDDAFFVPDAAGLAPTDRVLDVDRRDRSLVIFTSGTTGTPKGVVHTFESYFYMGWAGAELNDLRPDDRILEFRALTWLSPQGLSLAATLLAGATLVLARTFSRSRYFAWVVDHRITVAVSVPTAINMLLAEPVEFSGADHPHLRHLTSSTAALSLERQLEFEARYGVEILTMYGMSEAGWMAGNRAGHRRLGTVGFPTASQRLRIEVEGRAVPPGSEGEIVTGGPQAAWGYVVRPGVEEPLEDREAIHTGDLGVVEDGYLTIVGRAKDIIIRGGVNIAPAEINEALCKHPAIRDAATVGVLDPIYGEEVVSFVSLREPTSAADLLKHCASVVSAYKLPREIVVVEDLPYTDRGKVRLDDLRTLYSERQSEEVST